MPLRKLCLMPVVFAAGLLAQSKTVLENEYIRVIDATDRPHVKGALHKHDSNRVMIYLSAGDLDVVAQDGTADHQHWKAGDVAWSVGGPLHTSENIGDAPLHIIEVEVKKPGPSATLKRNADYDPLAIDKGHNKLIFENAQVRVFRSTLDTGDREKWHEHAGAGRLTVLLTPLSARMETNKKPSTPMNGAPGDVFWSDAHARHRASNLGHKSAEAIVVEVK